MDDRKHKNHSQLNNAGMTLVELLVAIAILGIIVVPFLHAFISSIRTNAKARENLRVTTVAQDITEGFKAYDMEELCYQYNFPAKGFRVFADNTVSGASVKEVLWDAASGSFVDVDPSVRPADPDVDPHASVYSPDGGDTFEYLGQKSGQYYFAMSGVSYENQKYDALVSMNALPYRAGGSSTFRPNAQKIAVVEKMNVDQDGFFVQEKGSDEDAFTEMQNTSGETIDKLSVDRTITIKITSKTVPDKPDEIKATISYNYIGNAVGDATKKAQFDKESVMFNNVETGEPLRNLYLCYYPFYSEWRSDNIIIDNQDNVPVTVYLIKQMNNSLPVANYENTYRLKLSLMENHLSYTDSETVFCTNLGKNIMTETDVPTQVEFRFNSMLTPFSNMKTKNLTGSEEIDRLYDIEVGIYKEGAALNGFPDADRLLIFDGSKDD